MNHPSTTNLLRRTFLGLAAVLVMLWALPAAALTVTLQNSTGNNCTYSGMSVDPAGNVTVTCQGSVTPGSPGTFTVGLSTLSATTGQVVNGSIFRSSGTTGAVNVAWAASGSGCATNSGTVTFNDGDGTAKAFSITMGSSAGTCNVNINVSAGTIGNPGSAAITVTSSGGGGGGPIPGCPARDPNWVSTTIPFQGKNIFSMSSGNIAYAPLPTLTTSKSGVVHNSESTNSPDPVTVELAISKCPGQVDNSLGTACYVKSGVRNLTDIYWMIGASSGITSATVANAIGICWTDLSQGPYYVNIRWTYQAGSCTGGGICGFNVQWNNSGF